MGIEKACEGLDTVPKTWKKLGQCSLALLGLLPVPIPAQQEVFSEENRNSYCNAVAGNTEMNLSHAVGCPGQGPFPRLVGRQRWPLTEKLKKPDQAECSGLRSS